MSDIFPFLEPEELLEVEEDLPLAREWAWDFEKGDLAFNNNKPYMVEGVEAVKVWVYKSLTTERYRYIFYSWDYGSELVSLLGSPYSQEAVESEVKRLIEEALMENPYIEGTRDYNVVFVGDSLSVGFVIETVYGETEVSFSAN